MEPKYSRTHPPRDLAAADWQRALRRQFGREQSYVLTDTGAEPFFSEFSVANPQSKTSYRVAIRDVQPGENFCACPDYATNELGTCKHIEFVLATLMKKRGPRRAFGRGYQPAFSELYLRSNGTRAVYFRAGTDCPASVRKAASRLFGQSRDGQLPEKGFDALEHFISAVTKTGHELRAYDDALDFVAGRRGAIRREAVLAGRRARDRADWAREA